MVADVYRKLMRDELGMLALQICYICQGAGHSEKDCLTGKKLKAICPGDIKIKKTLDYALRICRKKRGSSKASPYSQLSPKRMAILRGT